MNPEIYNSPYAERWCRNSPLIYLFSEQNKAKTWRQLWIWLSETERELDLQAPQITEEMLAELRAQKGNINWERVRQNEAELKHDVMAHIHTYSEVCPKAAGIIHLGVTSCFVQDNADLIIQRQALEHILQRLAICLDRLAEFALRYASTPTVGRTHFQHASLTTVGKRAALWADGLLHAFQKLNAVHSEMRFRGVKGAVGTQDALLHLFNGDCAKVEALDAALARKAGFEQRCFDICGQTYPRYQDCDLLYALSLLGAASKKLAFDIRLLQQGNNAEMAEPFEENQVGSSAMPYKRNPIKSERICGIARHLINSVLDPLETFGEQGFERTLDDSANRRIVIPDAFLGADSILSTLQNVLEGLRVNEEAIAANVHQSVPTIVLERALMLLTEKGESRQQAHARIREIALKAGPNVEAAELANALPEIRDELLKLCQQPILLCGRAEQQTRHFVINTLRPAIADTLGRVKDAGERKRLDV